MSQHDPQSEVLNKNGFKHAIFPLLSLVMLTQNVSPK